MQTPDHPRPHLRARWAAILIGRARHDLGTAAHLIDGVGCDCHGEDALRSEIRALLGPLAHLERDAHAVDGWHAAEDDEAFGDL